jgi:hypothetical protein
MASISPICKKCKKNFYFSPQVPYLNRLHDKKIIKTQDIKISHLGAFKFKKLPRMPRIPNAENTKRWERWTPETESTKRCKLRMTPFLLSPIFKILLFLLMFRQKVLWHMAIVMAKTAKNCPEKNSLVQAVYSSVFCLYVYFCTADYVGCFWFNFRHWLKCRKNVYILGMAKLW